MTDIVRALAQANVPRTRAGARHLLGVPAVSALAADTRLLDVARHHVGTSAFPLRATLFEKSSSRNWLVIWHQDTALPVRAEVPDCTWGPYTVKEGVLHAIAPAGALNEIVALRVHLDDSRSDNGPLRVLPRTHRGGLLPREQIDRLGAEVEPVACVADAGGVVVMRPLLVHASSKSTSHRPRRVLHIEYASGPTLQGVELAAG